jgi:hypothetical protein
MGIMPNEKFTDEKFIAGVYYVGGIEGMVFSGRGSIFAEIGFGTAFKNKAEKAVGSPFYANGLHISMGIRLYIGK